ncbi:hypothetical protein [Granulicella sibirica]|uniref:hypothetical protein n=1 Tax=Granulicella sibirica TaxID=2479048 RepID=UPI0010089E7A|nr:hypothetical protein [Granulicella sibirica]
MNNRTLEIGSGLESLLGPSFSNTFVNTGPWLIIVGVLLGVVFLAVCVVIYLQRPNAEDKEARPTLTIKVRGPASNLVRPRRPGSTFNPVPPAPAVPTRARWEALDTPLPQADSEPILEAESVEIVEVARDPVVSPDPPIAELPPSPASIESETPRQPLIPIAPLVLSASVPSGLLFESVQSTTTPRSLAFGHQATTLNPPRLPRIAAPPPPVILPTSEPEPEPELILAPSPEPPVLEIEPDQLHSPDPEPLPEPIGPVPPEMLPLAVELRTEPLPPPRPPIPEIRTEPLPPAPGEILEAEPLSDEVDVADEPAEATPAEPPKVDPFFLHPSPAVPIGEDLPSRLTPFQRMKRRRAVPTLDKNGRATYITYTFDPDADSSSDEKSGV